MTPFTCATTEGTLVIGKDDDSHIYLEVFDVPPEPSRASIRNSAVLGVAAALLEAAGYGREAAALPKAALDEMTRTASEDGTADEVDEFVNTRPKFTEGDRVVRRSDKYNDQPGIVTTRTFTRMGDPAWMVLWDDDPEEEEGPYQDWELRKADGDD